MSAPLHTVYPLYLGPIDLSITTPVIIMWGASAVIFAFLFLANKSQKVRNVEAFFYDFVVDAFANSLHTKRRVWFSFLMTLFLFVFLNNLAGLLPGGESPTSNINVTGALAISIFVVSQLSGVWNHGARHALNLIPSGIPKPMLLFFVPLEIIGQLARPFSLAVRLFANMFAGHKVLTIFIGLAIMSPSFIKALPFAGVVMISMFEIFVAFIQAFIFTYLASFYISDAVSGSH